MWRFLAILLAATTLKILFIFSYHSTDFEVHRNWMALTHTLPISRWYFESTSKWTLDYPPLFAWFEWMLSQIAVLFDPEMCVISESAYVSQNAVIFQRFSVISTEFLLFFALWRLCAVLSGSANNVMKRRFLPTAMFLAFNFGLFVIDHIHFQYNGFLFGILFLSGAFLVNENYVMAAVCFTVLLNMKHIFIYVAPVYLVFILFNYCLSPSHRPLLLFATKLVKVGTAVLVVTFLSFGPFLSESQLRQIFARLFPFERGLTHAYWAPNVWAVYNTLEKLLCSLNIFVQFWPQLNTTVASMTGGLVGQINHVVLPNIRPLHTVTLTLSFMLPSLIRCTVKSSAFGSLQASTRYTEYLTALIGAAWSSFLFGWHVHEKAVLMVLLPLNLLAIAVPKYSSLAFYVTTLGHFSLIPLIPTLAETPAVVSTFLAFTSLHWLILFRLHQTGTPPANPKTMVKPNAFVASLARTHLLGLIPLYVCCFFIWPLTNLRERLPFVPLLATSVYTALGLCFAFIYFLYMSTFSPWKPVPVATAMEKSISSRKKNKKLKTQ